MSKNKAKKNELDEIINKVGIVALSLGGAFLGYKLGKSIIVNSRRIDTKKIENKVTEISKYSDIKTKLQVIEKNISSNDWMNKLGASLSLFSELEYSLELLHNNKIPHLNSKKNIIKKLGTLKGERIISEYDYQEIKNIIPIRNNLVHGNYKLVTESQLNQCYLIISTFLLSLKT